MLYENDLDFYYPKIFEDWKTQSNINLNLSDINQVSSNLSINHHKMRFIEILLNWASLIKINISLLETNKNFGNIIKEYF